MHTKRKLRWLLICAAAVLGAQPAYVIQDARVYTVTGPVLERASIVIQDGKIREVGVKITVPTGAVRVDARRVSPAPCNDNPSSAAPARVRSAISRWRISTLAKPSS